MLSNGLRRRCTISNHSSVPLMDGTPPVAGCGLIPYTPAFRARTDDRVANGTLPWRRSLPTTHRGRHRASIFSSLRANRALRRCMTSPCRFRSRSDDARAFSPPESSRATSWKGWSAFDRSSGDPSTWLIPTPAPSSPARRFCTNVHSQQGPLVHGTAGSAQRGPAAGRFCGNKRNKKKNSPTVRACTDPDETATSNFLDDVRAGSRALTVATFHALCGGAVSITGTPGAVARSGQQRCVKRAFWTSPGFVGSAVTVNVTHDNLGGRSAGCCIRGPSIRVCSVRSRALGDGPAGDPMRL